MKSLRKMVSVILCVVISCMCFVTPAHAAAPESVNSTVMARGIVQVKIYPTKVDANGNETYYAPCSSLYYSGGAFLVNLTVDNYTKSIYNDNGCNYWTLEIYYAADSSNQYLDVNIDNTLEKSIRNAKSNGSVRVRLSGDTTYVKYELVWHHSSGITSLAGGHVNI